MSHATTPPPAHGSGQGGDEETTKSFKLLAKIGFAVLGIFLILIIRLALIEEFSAHRTWINTGMALVVAYIAYGQYQKYFGSPADAGSHGSGGHGGGHGHGHGGGPGTMTVVFITIGFLAIAGLAVEFLSRNTSAQNPGYIPAGNSGGSQDRSFWVTANPGGPTPIPVDHRFNLTWSIEGDEHVLFWFDGGPKQEDWRGQVLRLPPTNGDRTFYVQATGDKPVSVRIFLTPVGHY